MSLRTASSLTPGFQGVWKLCCECDGDLPWLPEEKGSNVSMGVHPVCCLLPYLVAFCCCLVLILDLDVV